MAQKRLMIAAPASGSGKTVLTLSLLRALRNRGIDVAAAKAGPDYIDPAFHAAASGYSSVNLDPWAMSRQRIGMLADTQPGTHLLIEAMMGLFDGAADGTGSAADLSVALHTPVLLVIDAAKQSHSVAALAEGFSRHRNDVSVTGVLLNKVGSLRHEKLLRAALQHTGLPVVGAVPRSSDLVMPERHLGLVQAEEIEHLDALIENASKTVSAHCDLARLENLFAFPGESGNSPFAGRDTPLLAMRPPGQRIAVARDRAFAFLYPHMLEDWHRQGAEIMFFSPLANEGPSRNADAVYLPGGYPELHGSTLAAATGFKSGMQQARDDGALIYGECGGYMVLGEAIVDAEGRGHKMLGFLALETSFRERCLHLGYRRIEVPGSFFLGNRLHGHEFHYTTAVRESGESLFRSTDALGEAPANCGLRRGNVMGSYLHVIDVAGDDG